MKKRSIILLICLFVLVIAAVWGYNKYFSTTKIAFINFQTISLGSIAKANDNSFIQIKEVSVDDLDQLDNYDMIFLNGMGLRIVEEQRAQIQRAADKGIPIYTSAATNPANNICNLDSIQQKDIREYLGGGGRRNNRSLLNYIRKNIDKKISSIDEPEEPVKRPSDVLYHADLKGDDDLDFLTVEEYEKYLKDNNLWTEGGKKIAITGQMADPTDLISALEKSGINVYPISSFRKLQDFIREISPDAVINLPHGRMGDKMVEYLTERNIPLFAPITINSLVEDWENDPMGMSGGFLSQSVVTPEIDGAIRSFALFAQYKDDEGLHHSFAVPERLETFIKTVKAYLELKDKPNKEKRVAIYYFKGPGQNAMTAGGMEVAPSLYNLLVRMKAEGYKVDNLPSNHKELEKMIMSQGAVFGAYAEGAFDEFMKTGKPELISKEDYESWVKQSLRPEKYAEVLAANGEFPGSYMTTEDGRLGVARLQFGNVVLVPQNAAGSGSNSFEVVHGTNAAPPHTYIASYLWMQHGFKADALIHFGTHGSLEFTPKKQVGLSSLDWPDRLVGAVPHFYVYSIGNVGEGVIAKRRSYAGLQSYLTPPFLESSVRGIYRELMEKIKIYNNTPSDKLSLEVKAIAVKMGIHRELGLDSILTTPYTEDHILKIENFAEELATEKITGQLYTMGVPYESARITSSVYAMATEPIAYSLLSLDKLRGRADEKVVKNKGLFTQRYLNPARTLVERLIANPAQATDELICKTANISIEELQKAREIDKARNAPTGMMAMMMAASSSDKPAASKKAEKKEEGGISDSMRAMMRKMAEGMDSTEVAKIHEKMRGNPDEAKKMMQGMAKDKPEGMPKEMPAAMAEAMKNMGQSKKEYSKEEVNFALAVLEVEQTIKNIGNYKAALLHSPEAELNSAINAMNGGYTPPSPGGDPIANPNTIPTGRNLYSINAEATPSESAWEKGVKLAQSTIDMYRERHDGEYPRKVSYTLWSGEFIETGGATIAQVLYMLGVEPIRDTFGRVSDLKLIPSAELGRPRIDVVVQTSGQLRDIAASRLFLINRAVEMAAAAKDGEYENMVAASVVEAERVLTEKGLSPKDAREISTFRVFGGVNGGYGTGIQGMVESGDRWEEETEIANVYLNNMGAFYGSEKNWETVRKFAFEAALTRTDVVIQPRQSNTWGALSLDHVYEFMGGLNLAVRNVTGKDPDAYLSDYRNRNNMRMQELKEAIGVESRTTIFNPTYIKEKMKGEASSAGEFAETIRNTYGWNVMKPSVIDKELWDEIYEVYVKDKHNLNVQEFFETQNPAALEEMTAVMLETVRKGMWKASEQQVADISKLHTELVNKYRPSCSGFVCDNAKLRDFIASKTDQQSASEYKKNIAEIREAVANDNKGVVMKKDELNAQAQEQTNTLSNITVGIVIFAVLIGAILFIRYRRKKQA
ncbi:cobaltochelatase subunit CobN [Bacteroides sp. 51]|uniref:cobaltochelatase subunit CobN n=1 Tax=Bacteroides sp. 51 TaxID=2302938 RepID=UPI0013D677E1|nr:cobaltochelatase subunit CobN [Bacteroides sp. 51]NDV82989.1 cobaltochelatase subunit CobN [Bacteroides sp. 51]